MKIIDNDLLAAFREAPACEWCYKDRRRAGGLHPHHLWHRGMAGGGRLDVWINLIALCPPCHNDVHAGVLTRFDVLAVVAVREAVMQDDIEAAIHALLRHPKHLPLPAALQKYVRRGAA